MTRLRPARLSVLLAFAFTLTGSRIAAAKNAPAPPHWVGTWATADVERSNAKGEFGAADMTFREIVHVSLGGGLVRIELSNEFGTEPLTIGAAHVALTENKTDIALPTANALLFSGRETVTIPPGGIVVSDPVKLALPAFADLTVSLFVPAQKITHLTVHGSAYQTNYTVTGNAVGSKTLTEPKKQGSWFFLKAVDVEAPAEAAAVVAFGDSITDGTYSTSDTNQRWPDLLAQRLAADKKTANLGVLNVGIGGNRVLHDVTGPNALSRFDTDVLAQSGVKYMIVLESINDIGHAYDPAKPYDVVTAEDIIAGLTQMIERAHMHGIKVFGATCTPYVGAKYSSPAGEAVRTAVNTWIRTSKKLDGVVDFDKATQDPANPTAFAPAYDHGDHLHPNDAGMKAMAGSIDLKLFTEK
ncbi:Lysophospholipase L1 [Granulicella rosea]|uniref:Lysophospholipase L1 n=1 Tax=Granulicella rosea TaxID=474952 RepID=A0A239L9V1_9BACT|nr:SGNH/GDSL hydrolase family protein [Granulicella rosea]SNT26633.1 Lysophospholipase L1 [Granulicella rosea]